MDVEEQVDDWPLSLANVDFSVDDRKEVVAFVANTKYPNGGEEAEKYRNELQRMPFHSLVGLLGRAAQLQVVADEKQKKQRDLLAEIERREQALFFNKPRAAADFAHWARFAYWSIDAGVALLLGKTPEIVTWEAVKRELPSEFAVRFQRMRDLARSHLGGLLTDPIRPSTFLRWAQRFDLPIPLELLQAVEKYAGNIVDWQDACDAVKTQAEGLKTEVDQWKEAYRRMDESATQLVEQVKMAYGIVQSQKLRISALEQRLADLSEDLGPPDDEAGFSQPEPTRPARLRPDGGDGLTPIVWDVCYDIYESGGKVTAGPVMAKLRAMAESKDQAERGCLIGAVMGGVKWEVLGGDEKELNANSLNARIREWRGKTGLG